MISLPVENAMSTPVRTASADLTVAAAAREMRNHGIGSLVVTEDGDVAGMVTQSDILGVVAAEGDLTASIAGCLSSPAVTVGPDAPILEAAALMREHSVRRIPVLDGDALVGIVTTTDLTHYLPRLRNTVLRERAERERKPRDEDGRPRERDDLAVE